MKNFISRGDHVTVTAAADIASGDFVLAGKFYGVAVIAGLTGSKVPLDRNGVYEMPKAAGAWSQGDALYWDSAAKNFTKTAAGNAEVGIAFADALAGDATGKVDIRPGFSLAVA
jgi:predicted RecA/RadA family phage recombinase